MATTILCSVGSRSADNVTVNSVSGSDPGPYTVTLSAAVPATTKIGDTFTDSGARKYLITGISGSDLTVYKRHFGAGADPATGAGTTQRAYATCKAWADAAPADLTAVDQQWIGECYNDATITESDSVSLDSTSDATRNMILRCATGQSYKDHANKLTNALRPNQSNGVLLSFGGGLGWRSFVLGAFSKVQGVQVTSSGSYGLCEGSGTNTVEDMGRLENVLAKLTAASEPTARSKRCSLINCVLISSVNQQGVSDEGSVAGRISSCTIINVSGASSVKGLDHGGAVYNTAVFGFGADNTVGSGSNNATDRSTFGGGTSNQTSLTTADQIESASSGSEDLRAKATGSLDTNGIRDQTWTADLDIVGQDRSTTTPTIGAWEVVAGGASAEGGGMLLGSRRNRLTIP